MIILAIETSCDETALSIIQTNDTNTNFKVLSDLVISQIDIHAEYGGVFPALAKREHTKNLIPLLKKASLETAEKTTQVRIDLDVEKEKQIEEILRREPELAKSLLDFIQKNNLPKIDLIMVTHGPGLAPALWVGVNFARALSVACNCNILPVNHMEGHITSIILKDDYRENLEALYPLPDFKFPLISLLISGGHTQIILVKDWCNYEILGETIDDAAGEAFDKVARMLGYSYPGGPHISKHAKNGKENDEIQLPRPMLHSKDYRFSFSGLKTAARYLIENLKETEKLDEQTTADICREFEHAVTEVLIKKTMNAIHEHEARGLIIAGGVSANTFIKESFTKKLAAHDLPLYLPEKHMCGDNSLMIATAGFINLIKNKKPLEAGSDFSAIGNLKL